MLHRLTDTAGTRATSTCRLCTCIGFEHADALIPLVCRYPGNVNLSFAYVEGESLIMGLKELAVSSGSACTSASLEPSYVLRALGVEEDMAHTSIRYRTFSVRVRGKVRLG